MAKIALILGGTKGLGLSLAWEGYRRGVQTIIAGRSVNDQKVKKSFPPGASWLVLDLASPTSVTNVAYLQSRPIDYIFWVAGVLSRMPFCHIDIGDMDRMIATHLTGPLHALRLLHISLAYKQKHPYHLITIASTSSWRVRDDESVYCALKAAKAAFTRNFTRELVRDLPGSKVTLINPGGMKTENFWEESGQDISNFMEPDAVAKIIWEQVEWQNGPFKEIQIMRNDDGTPNLWPGPQTPELPFK